jgi:hypothetical protein
VTIIPALLKLTAALSILFTASVVIIRMQPYTPAELPTSLTMESCALPCFMGIRPGVTTGYDALERLRTSRWVRYIQNINVSTGTRMFSGSVSWEWSGKQPAWIDPHHDSWLWIGETRVEYIAIRTRLSLGDLWLAYGAPTSGTIFGDEGTKLPFIYYEAVYPRQYMLVTVRGVCPFRDYWSELALITFRDVMPSRLPALPRGAGLPTAIRSQCTRLLNQDGIPSP